MAILTFSTELKIASGWNNTAGYSLFTDLLDDDSIPYLLPMPFEGASIGSAYARMSGRTYEVSEIFIPWYVQGMTLKGLVKLRDDYQNTNDAKVTIRTVSPVTADYEDFNAYIVVPTTWQAMLGSRNGVATVSPGSYKSNWSADVTIGFNVKSEAS